MMNKENLINDIGIAQMAVSKPYSNNTDKVFHENSFIYRGSNEKTQNFVNYYKNKKDILTVISSSDQLLNAIYMGARNIDAFDISTFPKYYMYLKLAALKALSKEDYLDFFYSATGNNSLYDIMYFDGIKNYLSEDMEMFWTSLINFFDWTEITFSSLFSGEVVSEETAQIKNIYLNNYEEMKNLIDKVSIKTYEGNILELVDRLDNKYDLAYLSNIMNYLNPIDYKNMLNKINLKEDGKVLTYIYNYNDKIKAFFNEGNYSFDKFNESNSGILVYKK